MADKHQQTNKHQFAQLEEEMLETWAKEKTFEQSVSQREGAERFSFFDGPPYANGLPHHGHVVPSTIKDAITRYKTMQGYYVPRVAGWDTHGLPVEQKIEKELGFNSRQEIEAYGIDKFNQACRDSVLRYKGEWEQFITRLGRWVDFENAYITFNNEYMESIWWVFKQIWDKDLVYEDFKSMPYCPRCATPLANFEVSQGYQDNVEDPSVYIKFTLRNEDSARESGLDAAQGGVEQQTETYNEYVEGSSADDNAAMRQKHHRGAGSAGAQDDASQVSLLAWTTTPWSLPGNAGLAVNPEATYVRVKHNQETLILAKDRLEILNGEYHLEEEIKGSELVGKAYYPLFELDKKEFELNENVYRVWQADFVGLDEGTGIVHVAPAFGADDLELSKSQEIPVLQTVDNQGHIKSGVGLPEIEGKFFKSADKFIIKALDEGLYHSETIRHTYPFCWRCDSPLLYYAVTTWFIKTDSDQLVKNNAKINWVPNHVKEGRFGKWLEGARDWSFSRNRYWGAPLPIWRSDDGEVVVIDSIEELKKRAVNPDAIDDLHRPYIDDVVIKTDSGKEARRVEEVFDVWFESGAVPYASNHYPFENKEEFKDIFPANFIAESIDQTRGWFYTLHVEASSLFDKPAFENVIVSGWVVAADGQKLSKKLKNYTSVDEVFDHYGADTLRYFMATSPVVNAEDVGFSTDSLRDVQRNVFGTLWNSYKFFKMYADVDGWQPPEELQEPDSDNVLDQWILSRLNQTIVTTTKNAEAYQVMKAATPVKELIDDLSNWYVRRSRRRFWKGEDDEDKQSAYATLHFVLVRICQLLAPFAPFMSDKVYRELRGSSMPESVHLTDWPEAGEVDNDVIEKMATTREAVTEGLQQRADAGIKVRQPLSAVSLPSRLPLDSEFHVILIEELNVKQVASGSGTNDLDLDTSITPDLKREGLMREVVRHVQSFRKQSGLNVDDRISLQLVTSNKELAKAIEEHAEVIKSETLATELNTDKTGVDAKTVKVEDADLQMSLEKA